MKNSKKCCHVQQINNCVLITIPSKKFYETLFIVIKYHQLSRYSHYGLCAYLDDLFD